MVVVTTILLRMAWAPPPPLKLKSASVLSRECDIVNLPLECHPVKLPRIRARLPRLSYRETLQKGKEPLRQNVKPLEQVCILLTNV